MSTMTPDVLAANVVAMWAEDTLGLTTEQASQLCDRISDAVREQVRTLEADNAALLTELRNTALRTDAYDDGPCWCEYTRSCEMDKHGPECWPIRAMLDAPHPGAALLAEMEDLRAKTSVSMGVGDGSGSLFVYGDHASIKAAQSIILERDSLRARVTVAEERASVLTTERNALLEQVRNLTEERDASKLALSDVAEALGWKGQHDSMATFVSVLRARVAELERDASLARDAALEEAEQRILASTYLLAPLFAEEVRALKSQPARRFVDAEEVALAVDDACNEQDADLRGTSWIRETILTRLGLTLDVETP